MNRYIVIDEYNFYMSCGSTQNNNVNELLSTVTRDQIKRIYHKAQKHKIAVQRDPVRSKLLGLLLLECNKAINKSTP